MEPLLTLHLLIVAPEIGLKSIRLLKGGKGFVPFSLIQHLLSACCVQDTELETLKNVKTIRSYSLLLVHL